MASPDSLVAGFDDAAAALVELLEGMHGFALTAVLHLLRLHDLDVEYVDPVSSGPSVVQQRRYLVQESVRYSMPQRILNYPAIDAASQIIPRCMSTLANLVALDDLASGEGMHGPNAIAGEASIADRDGSFDLVDACVEVHVLVVLLPALSFLDEGSFHG